jgi:hypothetical protein
MISEKTFNKVRDELIELGAETFATKKSFTEFSREVDRIRKENEVPIDEMNIILDMLTRWMMNNGDLDA